MFYSDCKVTLLWVAGVVLLGSLSGCDSSSGAGMQEALPGAVASGGIVTPTTGGITADIGNGGPVSSGSGANASVMPGTAAVQSAGGMDPGAAAGAGSVGGAPQTGATGGQAGLPPAGAGSGCQGLSIAPTQDYAGDGPYGAQTVNNTGPDGAYTLIRPAQLGAGGVTHPIATWGNGITTTPALYPGLLNAIASHGFVIIASNSTTVTSQLMTSGLDWLIEQNAASGELQGKLQTECAVSIGYSLGGGAAVGAGGHPNVIATVSFHGLQGAAEALSGPLFLLTSTNDGFVTKSQFVAPTYNRSSQVPTIMATLEAPGPAGIGGHLIPLGDAGEERAPAIAWLRYWVYGDQGARSYFFGSDCTLCQSPWTDIQRKNADWN